MKYIDLCRQAELRETKADQKNNLIAQKFLADYLQQINKNELLYQTGNPNEDLLYEYFSVKGTEYEEIFLKILNLYNFNYSMSIHNAIYYLLARKKEKEHLEDINPLSMPGVNNFKLKDSKYILESYLGNIEVYKANEFFSNSPSYHIFDRDLIGQCYDRTYDFLRENPDYLAVLSYMPNFFYGGHYHAYLEKDNQVLDIASNAFYSSKSSIEKIFCGEIIAKLTWKQVQEKIKTIQKTTPEITSEQKLRTLTLYYDWKNHQKN